MDSLFIFLVGVLLAKTRRRSTAQYSLKDYCRYGNYNVFLLVLQWPFSPGVLVSLLESQVYYRRVLSFFIYGHCKLSRVSMPVTGLVPWAVGC